MRSIIAFLFSLKTFHSFDKRVSNAAGQQMLYIQFSSSLNIRFSSDPPFQSHCSFIRVNSVDIVADEDGDDHHDDDDVNIAAQLWSLQTGSGPPWAPRSSLLKENSKLNVWLNHLNRKAFLSNIFWVPSNPGAWSPYFISSSTIWLKPQRSQQFTWPQGKKAHKKATNFKNYLSNNGQNTTNQTAK